ncbi:hypothetical protein HCQ94_03885 [Actinomyces sp. zg-332]|uniref:zinc ribbon domain-containing protein n=1 Tax=Actinomyces sp. zg-332 TaxID=2708340 RepID=UPI001422721B|nr:hypothetical protein [Actinomyces sp. zg-332]QPK93741.1 hypothetical protein HCQ94_03885 [Actinomyces sp. zg-332]
MKAPIQMQRRLLDLQNIDVRIAKVNHFLATMPIDVKIQENKDKLTKIAQMKVLAEVKLSDIASKINIVNRDVDVVENRIKKQQERLDSSEFSPKEMQAIICEIEQMAKRKKVLEDNEITLLEENAEYEQKLEKIVKTQDKLVEIEKELEEQKTEKASEFIDMKVNLEQERKSIVAVIDEELLALYERVKKITGGIGAVPMRGNVVEGMTLEFSIAELDEIKKAPLDEVICSQDYDYILVRVQD